MSSLVRALPASAGTSDNAQARYLSAGIRAIVRARARSGSAKHRLALSQQPFDRELLAGSRLCRRSRRAYLELGGKFSATLVSSPRTLSSAALLEPLIEYSPIENELCWAAREPRGAARLLELRTYATSLFHEQNHRILWGLLPRAHASPAGVRRLLNLTESLVIALDMALGDELGPDLARFFHLTGVTYDPGTSVRAELGGRRAYRNYLQAALHATYLHLELYEPRDIPRAIRALFPGLGEFAERAAVRAGNLDRGFILRTNLRWQRLHYRELKRRLCGPGNALEVADDPMDNREAYLLGEQWFASFGL